MIRLIRLFALKPSTVMFLVMGSLVGALFFKAVARDPGYVLLAHGRHTIETSLLVGLLAMVLFFLFLYWLWRFLRWALDPLRGQRKANSRTIRGLIAFAEGDWHNAEKLMAKGAAGNDIALINYLTAAQAAHEQGEEDRRDDYLRLAHQTAKGIDIAVGLTKARLQFQSEQWEECLATLMVLKKNAKTPSYPYVIKMLSQVYVQVQDWDSLLELLPELKKRKVVSADELHDLERRSYEGKLKQAQRGSGEDRLRNLQQVWQKTPRKLHHELALIQAYSEALINLNAGEEAEKILTDALRKNWDDNLARLYGIVKGADVAKQLLWAENWLKERPNNAMLLLTLGRLSLQLQQWEQARSYFEASIRSRRSAEAHGELGRLLSHLGEHEASNENFQAGLALISQRLPDLPMPAHA
ncbi:MAG: heme biosynthesis HemY N-terminal domain-containing protein [Gammaproteobacteria bacterium]